LISKYQAGNEVIGVNQNIRSLGALSSAHRREVKCSSLIVARNCYFVRG